MRNFHKSSELSFFVHSAPVLAKHVNIQGQWRQAQTIQRQMVQRCHKHSQWVTVNMHITAMIYWYSSDWAFFTHSKLFWVFSVSVQSLI